MPRFVIHKHAAKRLHYDLRLEMKSVLESWAIPKNPTLAATKRLLAIKTEPHSVEYISFHGVIPKGMYGAGEVKIWDRGTYELLEKTDEKIVMKMNGKKLKGEYALIRFKKAGEKNWLFFKK